MAVFTAIIVFVVCLPYELHASALFLEEQDRLFISAPSSQVTTVGENHKAVFVNDDELLIIGSHRKAHKNPQLYTLDWITQKMKRITHQSGSITDVDWSPINQLVYYSSTTDEDKEHPLALKGLMDRWPASLEPELFSQIHFQPQEIYRSEIDGSNIERLTHEAGFDGFFASQNHNNRIYFSRLRNGKLSLYTQDPHDPGSAYPLLKTAGHDWGLKYSPRSQKWTWTRFSPDYKTSQLFVAGLQFQRPQFMTLDAGVHWSPVWHPNGQSIIYSARAPHRADFDLFEVHVSGKCGRQLTSLEGDEYFPTISPNGQYLFFTATLSGKEQIHSVAAPPPLQCEKAL